VPGSQFLRNRLEDRLDRIASGNMPASATGASPDGQGATPPRRWTGIGTWRIRNGAEEGAMTTEVLVIDCDGHILEPPDLWETYLEPAYRDRALRIRVGDDGFEFLEIDGRRSTIARPGQLGALGGMGKRVDEAREIRERAMRGEVAS